MSAEKRKTGALGAFLSPSAPAPAKSRAREAGATVKKVRQRRSLGDGRVPLQSYIMPDALQQLKTLAVQQDRAMTDLVGEAIDDLFAKYNLPQIARPAP